MGVGGQRLGPAALPPGMTRHPFYRRLGGPPGPVWTGAENSLPPGFDPRTVQLVVSRYTDYAIPAHNSEVYNLFLNITHNIVKCGPFYFHIQCVKGSICHTVNRENIPYVKITSTKPNTADFSGRAV
jgi:hypothetical protein